VTFIGTVPNSGVSPTGSIASIMVSHREQHVASIWITFAIGSHDVRPRIRTVSLKIGERSRRFSRQAASYGAAGLFSSDAIRKR
jgi:hypothetical protein